MRKERIKQRLLIIVMLLCLIIGNCLGTITYAHAENVDIALPNSVVAPEEYIPTESTQEVAMFSLRKSSETMEQNKVLLIEDILPWDSTANSDVLSEIGVSFEKVIAADFLSKDLGDYSVLIFANDQQFSTYEHYSKFMNRVEDFVCLGGVVIFGACDGGWASGNLTATLPGGVEKLRTYAYNNYIEETTHPIVTGELTDDEMLQDADLYSNYCSHTSFDEETLPVNSKVILRENNTDTPTLVEYKIGNGTVIASGLTWEFGYTRAQYSKKAMADLFMYAISISEADVNMRPPVALSIECDEVISKSDVAHLVAYVKNIGDDIAQDVRVTISVPEFIEILGDNVNDYWEELSISELVTREWKLKLKEEYVLDGDQEVEVKVELEYLVPATSEVETKEIVKKIHIENYESKKAILVVPGIMGSNLVDSDDVSEKLWMNEGLGKAEGLWKVVTNKISCDSNGESNNPDIIPLNGENEYGAIDMYENLIVTLRKEYGDVADIRFVPYDWRLDLEAGASEIEKVIREYDEVVIVAHSMGGLVTEKYIATRGTEKIVKVITAGTPYWGAPMACNTLYTGNVDAFPEFVGYVVEDLMLPIVVNFTGLYELLPNEYYTNTGAWLKREERTVSNFWEFLTGGKFEMKVYDWDKTENFYKSWFNGKLVQRALNDQAQINMSQSVSAIDSVEHTFIVGNGINTTIGSNLYTGSDYSNIVAYSDYSLMGDGTVPFRSQTMNRINRNMLSGETVQRIGEFVVINGVTHSGLVSEDEAIKEIVKEIWQVYNEDVPQVYALNRSGMQLQAGSDGVEEESQIKRILLSADCTIEISKDNEVLYYLHEDEKKQGQDVMIEYAGRYNELPVYMVTILEGEYDVTIKSTSSQMIQLAIEIGETIYSLEDSLGKGDIVTFNIGTQDMVIRRNNEVVAPLIIVNGVVQETYPEEMITREDINVMSMNVRSGEQYNNTINPRIKLVNNGEQAIELKQLTLSYMFDGDGYTTHNFVCDWAAVNHVKNISNVIGTFENLGQYDILKIEFPDSEISIEPGEEFEIHFRIHTKDWQVYDIWNDPSLAGDVFTDNPLIAVEYMGYLVQ